MTIKEGIKRILLWLEKINDKIDGGGGDEYNAVDGMFYISETFSEEDIAEIQKLINAVITDSGVTVDDEFSIEINQIDTSSPVFQNKEILYNGFKGFYNSIDSVAFTWYHGSETDDDYLSIKKIASPLYYKNK